MRAVHAMERRLQDLERKFQNKERLGKIVAIKFEKDRWYVKLNDGEEQTPSGSGDAAGGRNDTFKSDWQPWQSHSHETIKYSVPPKVGQHALMRSVGGTPELSTVEPFHYGPQTPSPHGKQDETVGLIQDKDDQQHWSHKTKDTDHLIIKTKQGQGGVSGLGDISGLGDVANIGQMAGLSGLDFSKMLGSLGNLGNLGNLGSLANIDVSNIANLSQISGLGDISKLASFGGMAKLVGMPDLAQLGNLTQIANKVGSAGLLGQVGSMIGGGAGGAAGVPASAGGQQNAQAPKLPDVPENGADGTTQVKSTKDFVLKTVGENKSYYKQDKDQVHLRYGEQDQKADILMNENEMVHQFKDKKAKVKWTENDLTVQMGEDDHSKMVMTEDDVTITQGGSNASKIVMSKGDVTISQGGNTSWKMSDGKLEVAIGGTTWTLDSSGWSQTGGSVAHDNKLIDSTHKHDGVQPGAGLTGIPFLPKAG